MSLLHSFAVLFVLAGCVLGDMLDTLQQPHISPPKHSQFRDIIWGDLNFLHTTDTHGWYAGHINQKQYSADWGDFVSLSKHLRKKAEYLGVDLLVVDTGDKHDGNGLSDASSPNGLYTVPIFNKMDYDLVTLGNHELYTEEVSTLEYEVSVPHYGEKYVSTNVEYLLDNGTWVPFGERYRYFSTPNRGNRVLALSFLFNFRRFNAKTRVSSIADTLQEDSFHKILDAFPEESLDYIVVYGHIPVTDLQDDELLRLHIYLRRRYPNTVIQYFGGHSHIRDFAIYDYKATGLQSGRYCETLGWLSVNLTGHQPVFSRRYIDFNKESFIHHSGVSKEKFDTEEGLELTGHITDLRQKMNLTDVYGYVPESYLANAYPYGHPQSIYTLLNTTILPLIESEVGRSSSLNRAILVNSGGIRYDLYKGEFTKDTEFIVSPFQNKWVYITLPKSLAVKVAPYLNEGDYIMQDLSSPEKASMVHKSKKIREITALTKGKTLGSHSCRFVHERGLKTGYTTHDDFGCDGDDVLHNTIPYYPSPNIIGSYEERNPDSDMADLVFYDFIESWILPALNSLVEREGASDISPRGYTSKDVHYYGGQSTGELLRQHFAFK